MPKGLKMMKKLLIVSILLVSSANADLFKALKDAAAKAVEVQQKLNNQNDGNINQGDDSSDQSPKLQFNSLAEEMAYKKKQTMLEEQQKIAEEKQYKEKEKNREERFTVKQNAILEKYFIKKSDSPDMIESKYKNRVVLFSSIPKDYKELEQLSEYGETWENVMHVPSDIYLDFDFFKIAKCQEQECKKETFNKYEQYMKNAYETYESRQVAMKREKEEDAKRQEYSANADKEQKAKAVNEQKERQKVQGACQAWKAKANKGVYSLGVGDRISCGGSLVFVIQAVNANTFTVILPYYNQYVYKEKSMCVPAASLSSAPSQYCYR